MVATVSTPKELIALLASSSKASKAVILDCSAEWCGPCKAIAPLFARLGERFADRVVAVKMDVDQADALAGALGVTSMPTFVVYVNGIELRRFSGGAAAQLEAAFAEAAAACAPQPSNNALPAAPSLSAAAPSEPEPFAGFGK
jgi:thiol-disulfide isomerase/thioredoxin